MNEDIETVWDFGISHHHSKLYNPQIVTNKHIVYKDKSGKVCYDLRIPGDREFLFDPKNRIMMSGSYVYAKAVKKYREEN